MLSAAGSRTQYRGDRGLQERITAGTAGSMNTLPRGPRAPGHNAAETRRRPPIIRPAIPSIQWDEAECIP